MLGWLPGFARLTAGALVRPGNLSLHNLLLAIRGEIRRRRSTALFMTVLIVSLLIMFYQIQRNILDKTILSYDIIDSTGIYLKRMIHSLFLARPHISDGIVTAEHSDSLTCIIGGRLISAHQKRKIGSAQKLQ